MAVTAENKAAIAAQVEEVKAGVDEIKNVVYNSLSIQNVGGGHIFNLATQLEAKITALVKSVDAIEADV